MEIKRTAKERAEALVKLCLERGLHIAFAESCTGGLLAKLVTDIPGASEVFECAIVSYSVRIKKEVLGAEPKIIDKYGVVSANTALAMAESIIKKAGADIGVGVTGVAGPGADGNVPEGEIYVSVSDGKRNIIRGLSTGTDGEREYNRYFAAAAAFDAAIELLTKGKGETCLGEEKEK